MWWIRRIIRSTKQMPLNWDRLPVTKKCCQTRYLWKYLGLSDVSFSPDAYSCWSLYKIFHAPTRSGQRWWMVVMGTSFFLLTSRTGWWYKLHFLVTSDLAWWFYGWGYNRVAYSEGSDCYATDNWLALLFHPSLIYLGVLSMNIWNTFSVDLTRLLNTE